MGKSCCAYGCTNRFAKGSSIKFFRFPRDPDRKRLWTAAINRKNWNPGDHSWICSEHFISGEKSEEKDNPDYVPSIFSYMTPSEISKRKRSLERYDHSVHLRAKRSNEGVSLSPTNINDETQLVDEHSVTVAPGPITCTYQSNVECVNCVQLQNENNILQQEVLLYKEKLRLAELCHTDLEGKYNQAIAICGTLEQEDTKATDKASMYEVKCKGIESENQCLNAARNNEEAELEKNLDELKKEILELREENNITQYALSHLTFTEESFKDDDQKVTFYTGLPNFQTLLLVVQTLTLHTHTTSKKAGPPKSLSDFQEIILVLMKLRLNLSERDIAYRFRIAQSSVSRIFTQWIPVMAEKLKFLIQWPDRDEVRKTLPQEFRKHFPRCVAIIDCTEVYIERPSDLKARAQTWSQYKHHNTVKLLIAITPQGTVSFISKAWGGRASDKYITENSDFLDKLIPGDQILADRGFTIQESVGLYCADVKIPPFTKGKKQLARADVDWTRKLAHVCIHVERVIGQLKKKYSILQSIIPIKLLKNEDNCTIDSIVTTCCSLRNLSDSIVPFD